MLKRLMGSPWFQAVLGWFMAAYLRFCRATSRVTYEPPELYDVVGPEMPVIVAMWHGEHFVMPYLKRRQDKVKVLISLHRDGEINAIAARHLGIEPIRGSGSHGAQRIDKRGTQALIEMIRALEDGYNVATTADVPKISRKAGPGIVVLGAKTGRPIYPVAVCASRRLTIAKSWDKSKIPLPFGHIVIAGAEAIRVPPDATKEEMEAARLAVQAGLDEITARAYAIADGRR
jgi:hypothetical protein